jgi:hypothetical protein
MSPRTVKKRDRLGDATAVPVFQERLEQDWPDVRECGLLCSTHFTETLCVRMCCNQAASSVRQTPVAEQVSSMMRTRLYPFWCMRWRSCSASLC